MALWTVGAVMSAAVGLAAHSPALAHNVVIETAPANGDTVSVSPVHLRIVTNDAVLDLSGTGSGFAIVVQDSAGLHYGDGCVTVGNTDFSASADLGGAGEYRVTYQFVSADGHSLSDGFTFRFTPDATHTTTPGGSDIPECGAAHSLESGVDETTETDLTTTDETVFAEPTSELPTDGDEPERGVTTVAIAGVLIVLSVTLLVWMVRRRNGR